MGSSIAQPVVTRRYLWDNECADHYGADSTAGLIRTVDARSDEARNAAYCVVDNLIVHAREHFTSDLAANLPELLEACRVALICGPLLSAVREWVVWSQIKAQGVACSIVAQEDQVPRLSRDAEMLGIRVSWQGHPALQKRTSPVDFARNITARVRRKMASGVSWVGDRFRPLVFPAPSDRKRILFVDYYPHSTLIVIPLWRHLQAVGRYDLLYAACREKVAAALRHERVFPYVSLERFAASTRDDGRFERAWKDWVLHFVRNHWPDLSMPCTPTLERALLATCRELLHAKACRNRLNRVFEKFRPEIVINSTGSSIEARTAELLAQRSGAISLHVQHGLYEADPVRANSQSDFVCCWGQLHCDLLKHNPSRSQLVATGSPKHDEVWQSVLPVRRQDKPMIVYFSSRADGRVLSRVGYETHMKAIAAAARQFPNWDFVVKLHQADTYPKGGPALRELRAEPNVRVSMTENAYQLLRRASVAITYASTVAIEAIAFGTRLVFLNLTDLPDWLPVSEFQLAPVVRRREDLAPALEKEVELRHEQTGLRDLALLLDGQACQRIESLILQSLARVGSRPEKHLAGKGLNFANASPRNRPEESSQRGFGDRCK